MLRKILFLLAAASVTATAGAAAVLGLFMGYARQLPSVEELKGYSPGLITRLYDINDNLLASFYVERREIVSMDEIPRHLEDAVVAVEDANFFSHQGVDPVGILRAMGKNVMAGGIKQGGSTITQQVARAIFLTPERKVTRKIKEAILAHRLEQQFTKDDILWLYLNHIYFGHGAYGVEAAARTYFGKHVSELNLAESATLAGLPKAPSHYSPYLHPQAARVRLRLVLNRMVEEGSISLAESEAALETELRLEERKRESPSAPFFAEHVRRYLEDRYGSELLYRGGLRVYTTLDPRLQEVAEREVAEGVRAVDRRQGFEGPLERVDLALPGALEAYVGNADRWPASVHEEDICPGIVLSVEPGEAVVRVADKLGALPLEDLEWTTGDGNPPPSSVDQVLAPGDVVSVLVTGSGDDDRLRLSLRQEPDVEGALVCLDPRNGQVMAMVGGYDFARNQYNRAVQSHRQPGSAFKPFIYAGAIESGMSPADIIIDSPIVYENEDEEAKIKKWKPVNYDERFDGPIRLREALNKSRNLPTIKLLKKVGIGPVIDLARRLGIKSPLAADLSMALGSSGVTLMELTAAYGVFGNQGIYTPPRFIRYITDRSGTLLEVHQPKPQRVLDETSAYIVNSMLQTVVQDGTGWRAKYLGRPVGGKTGTTNDFMDAWFMGYTPQLVTGVWVGMDVEKALGPKETGSRAAAPIWAAFMKEAVRDLPVEVFGVPPDVTFVRVDAETGLLASPRSRATVFEVYRQGTEPTEVAHPEVKSPTDFFRLDLDGL